MDEASHLPEVLRFRPRWWWDPVPPWLVEILDREVMLEVAKVQVEFQRNMLTQQAEAMGRIAALLARTK